MGAASKSTANGLNAPSNGAKTIIESDLPITLRVTIEGVSGILFHRWDCDAVEEKSKAKKGSATKKTDNVESYLYRVEQGNPKSAIAVPGEYLRQALIGASKNFRDPSSKGNASLMGKAKASLIMATELSPLYRIDDGGKRIEVVDYVEDRRRVTIQKAAITRVRPMVPEGWRADFLVTSLLPEYIDANLIAELAGMAGKFVGLADFRPTFGRFRVVSCDVERLD